MNRNSMQESLDHLQLIKKIKKEKDRLNFMNICSDNCIHSLCEACFNLIHNNIPLEKSKKSRLKKKLTPIRFHLRKLADPTVSVKDKRDLLKDPQVGGGIFSLIAAVVPALISALLPK